MTYIHAMKPVAEPSGAEPVRRISTADLRTALRQGIEDFSAIPTHAVFLVVIYPIIGLLIARFTMGEDLLELAYPLAAGFALLGPFAAVGLYELSRRREQGLPLSWSHGFDVLRSPSAGTIAVLGAIQMVIFVAWIAVAHALYATVFRGMHPQSIGELVRLALSTSQGWTLIVLGNGIGFLFAALALTLSVVSFPLAVDRPVNPMTAIRTSVRAVQVNPGPMAIWGLIVAVSLLIGCATLFIGLAVILPVLGHATWHLYRLVVAPNDRR